MHPFGRWLQRTINRLILLALFVSIAVYFTASQRMTDLKEVQRRGTLHMLTILGPTTYFEDGRGPNGFEYILARDFADSIGVKLEVHVKQTLRSLLLSVGGPRADFAAANLTKTSKRIKALAFSHPYYEITQQLLYQRGSKRPSNLDELDGELLVIADSSHSERLQELKLEHPLLSWSERNDLEQSDLVRMVHEGEVEYCIVDSLAYLINRQLFPQAGRAFDITEPQPLAWAFPKHSDGTLVDAANKFLDDYRLSGKLDALKRQYTSNTQRFSVSETNRLGKLIKTRLPKFESLFREVGEKYSIDWHLLAAVAYQESHWNPNARSPTGVRGLMMLTEDTAKELAIANRVDPLQSLDGGARYILQLKDKISDRVKEPDRTWLALAAYNVGLGHLTDARTLTRWAGKNPDKWSEVRQQLPLLTKKQYHSTVRHGFARGHEPVVYVDNIQYYMAYLKLRTITNNPIPLIEQPAEPELDQNFKNPTPSTL